MNEEPLTAERLARETHAAFNMSCPGRQGLMAWKDLAPYRQDKYRAVARQIVAKYEVRRKPAR